MAREKPNTVASFFPTRLGKCRGRRRSRISVVLVSALLLPMAAVAANSNPDLNNDGVVNVLDLAIVSRCVGQNPRTTPSCRIADLNGDGIVDTSDLNIIRAAFGQSGFPVAPTAARITADATGQKVVKNEVVVVLNPQTINPDARILQIANVNGGTVIGGIKQTLTYQISFPVADLTALESIRLSLEQTTDLPTRSTKCETLNSAFPTVGARFSRKLSGIG
jgi:hypothetical protein